jgi:TolA-binding protein
MSTSKNKNGHGRVSDETVLSRARRMFRSEMKKVAQALGMETYEKEAFDKKIAELLKAREDGMSNVERQDKRMKDFEDRISELNTKLTQSSVEAKRLQRELQEKTSELEGIQTETEIRELAFSAGLKDVDYGIHQLRAHIRKLPEGEEINPEGITKFFETMKKSKPFLFGEERVPAGPSSLAEERSNGSAQPSPGNGTLPAQGAPPPSDPGKAQKDEVNALDMKKVDFNKHTREKYGFSPGMA